MRTIHVAVAQINSRAADIRGNLEKMHRQIRSAAAVGVEALLFAETNIHAYDFSPENLAAAQPVNGPIGRKLSEWAKKYDMTIMAGMLERDGKGLYNTHVIARPGKPLISQQKHILTPGEKQAGLLPGKQERNVFSINAVKCAVVICADHGIKNLHKMLEKQGVEYCFFPTAGGGKLEDYLREADLSRSSARNKYIKNRPRVCVSAAFMPKTSKIKCGFAAANAMGYDGKDRCHQGHCSIVDNNHVVRAQIPGTIILEHHQDQMAHAVINFPKK